MLYLERFDVYCEHNIFLKTYVNYLFLCIYDLSLPLSLSLSFNTTSHRQIMALCSLDLVSVSSHRGVFPWPMLHRACFKGLVGSFFLIVPMKLD